VITERERHGPGEVFDRADLLEDLLEAGLFGQVLQAGLLLGIEPAPPALVAEQPVERVGLQGEETRDFEGFVDTGEGDATWT
jgi:hypothetical protein